MASLPPSQRRPSSQRSSPQSSSPTQSHASARERTSSLQDDSQPLLLNPSSALRGSGSESQNDQEQKPARLQRQVSADIRRCWICYSDETEDGPTASVWRSPCPCALTAHEACLLDWVADLEVSNAGRRKRILCPQCKSEIRIARPRSLLVDLTKGLEAAAGRLVLPSIVILGSTTVMYLSISYGVVAVHLVLGSEDLARVLSPTPHNPPQTLRRFLGLSAVPWMLVLSRTSIADSVLPIIPMLFFVTQPRPEPLVDFAAWPPSAGMSFAVLPYVRAAYNAYYEYVWGDRVRRWAEEVKPRTGSSSTDHEHDALELQIGVEEDDDDDDEVEEGDVEANGAAAPRQNADGARVDAAVADDQDGEVRPAEQAHPLHAPPLDRADGAAQDQPAADNVAAQLAQANNQNNNNNIRANIRRDYSISISRVAQSVLGALAFPLVSTVMGDTLRAVLPNSWVSVTTRGSKPTRFLQTRWGRCIVGGCLFVVLKDAMALYVRWKVAQNHRLRKVVDYEKSKGKQRAGAGGSSRSVVIDDQR